ncbi:MAG: hypothetical protein K2O68_01600, partial [Mucispirillum sp.]|nr:hypothetical protein [Mucispirillum sp.]
FYVCQQRICINKVFKKKTVYKYLDESLNINLLYDKLKESIKNNTVYHINELFDKYNAYDTDIDTNKLVLYRYDVSACISHSILLDKAVYNGSKKFCIIYDKYSADKLIKYKNLITNIDGLFYGELNGI